ncbi:MAG: TylF/MycF/NovP-related O-methyltransferase [Alphaproteobacteria bacterium]
MKRLAKRVVQKSFGALGYEIQPLRPDIPAVPVEFSGRDREILNHVLDNRLTMVSRERLIATMLACKYVVANGIEGDFVECGVWRGGNAIAAKLVFESCGANRKVILFDTFAGMTEPTEADISVRRESTQERFRRSQREDYNEWCYASLASVKANFRAAGADLSGVRFIEGDVTETLRVPGNLPENISVLRLDTDWYELTKVEMEALYPRLRERGVLIIDDYGHWQGARKAIEEYFEETGLPRPLLQHTDYTGRMGIK